MNVMVSLHSSDVSWAGMGPMCWALWLCWECCSLWLIGSAGRCLLIQWLVRLNLVSLSFPTSDPPLEPTLDFEC